MFIQKNENIYLTYINIGDQRLCSASLKPQRDHSVPLFKKSKLSGKQDNFSPFNIHTVESSLVYYYFLILLFTNTITSFLIKNSFNKEKGFLCVILFLLLASFIKHSKLDVFLLVLIKKGFKNLKFLACKYFYKANIFGMKSHRKFYCFIQSNIYLLT